MIKSNELRLGNYVKLMLNHEDYDIIQIEWRDFRSWSEMYKPIPLTEEWLLKFGFAKVVGISGSYFKGICYVDLKTIGFENNKPAFVFRISGNELRYIEYVYQLQNLFHALTGQELELND